MRGLVFLISIVSVFFISSSAFSEFCPNLRNDGVIDQFVYRIATRYHLPPPASFFSQPMTVCDVLGFIDKADSLGRGGMLSAQETTDARLIRMRISADYSLLHWKDEKRDSRIAVRCNLEDTNSASSGHGGDKGFVRGIASPALNASLGKVSFYSSVDVWTDYRSDTLYRQSSYQPYDGVPYNLYGRADSSRLRSSDLLRGGLIYNGSMMRLELGIDRLRQGPAIASPLTFSGNAPPMTFVRGTIPFGFMDYTQTFGSLESEKDKPKYFYMHRISAPFFSSRLIAGLTEVVINGSTTNQQPGSTDSANALRPQYYGQTRSWELAYMIPFVPYAFAEHYLGDRDNKALSFDLNCAFPDNFRWYAEFFIDDMTAPWTLFSNDWGNKWALDVGGQYFTRFLSRDMIASLEYCRVEPWVYTHFYGGSHRYDNFNVPLGAPLGPNSDLLAFSCESRVFMRHSAGITFTNQRTNHAYRGGNITDVFQDTMTRHPDSPKKEFLAAAGRETVTRCGLYWTYGRLGKFRANFKYEYDFSGKSIYQVYGGLYF
jgi:hypothetical protein